MKIVLFFTVTFSAFAVLPKKSINSTAKKWNTLMRLIDQEISTIHNARKKTSSLQYRLLELQSEKLKLWKQKENALFMQTSLKGIKVSRKMAFKKTLSIYEMTKKQGLSLIKKHPKSPYKAAVYYTLALNSRDYAYDGKEYQYLVKALKLSTEGSEVNYFAKTSLAEYYYNKKKYKQAVQIYKQVTKNLDDEWHTKNLYNYGWCLLKTHKFDKAITTLETSYELSSKDYYIDFRSQVMDGLVNFYVLGKQIKRGREFILSKVDNKYDALFKYTKKVANKGFKVDAIELIRLTESYISKNDKDYQLASLRLFQFDFHKQFNEKEKMHAIAAQLSQIKLNEEQQEEITNKITEEVGVQQLILKNEYTKEDGTYTKSRLTTIISYLELLSGFDTSNKAKYLFYSAETLYTVAEFKKALTFYKKAIENQTTSKSDMEIHVKAIDSVFSCISLAKLSKADEKVELEYAYTKHISLWPKADKSLVIYPKLFSLYLFSDRFKKSQATINLFAKSFPKELKTQQNLFKQQIDYFIKNENISLIAQKINLMYQGFLSFSFEETKKTEKILADILFQKYQKLSDIGEKNKALAGYRSIFYKEQYPKSVRADAAFNMGIIYIDLYKSAKGIKWFQKSFPLFTEQEKSKRRSFLERVSLRSSLLQDFLNAANIQKIVLKLFCSGDKEKNLKSFNDAIIYDLANDYVSKAIHSYKTFKKCIEKDKGNHFIDDYIITHLYQMNHESMLSQFTDSKSIQDIHGTKLGLFFEALYWKFHNKEKKKEILYFSKLKSLNCKSCKLLIKATEKLASLSSNIKSNLDFKIKNAKIFNPEVFNKKLSQRLSSLKPILKEGDELLALAHPHISLLAYDKMTSFIEKFSNQVASIKAPLKDREFREQFRAQMLKLSQQIKSQRMAYIKNANVFVNKNEILSLEQKQTHRGFAILQIGETRSPAGRMLSTIDIGK